MNKWNDPVKASKAITASAWGKNREHARKLLMKAKIYRALAIFFALVGIIMVVQSFVTRVDGHFLDAMRNPLTIIMILVPFLPAFVLSLLSQKAEREFARLKPFESAEKATPSGTEPPAKK